MPKLPLPPLGTGVPIDGGDLPVSSITDVSGEWAEELEGVTPGQVLQALQAGQLALILAYQVASRYAAAQSDPGRATDEYLDVCLEERGTYRQTSEVDLSARTRMFAAQQTVSPQAVIAAANAILASYTSESCAYAEQSDGVFLAASTSAVFSSHVFDAGVGESVYRVPNYPDRLYNSNAPAGLQACNLRIPTGAMLNFDTFGRWFLLRVPDVDLAVISTTTSAFDWTATTIATAPPADGLFMGVGTTTTDQNDSFLYSFSATTTTDLYNSLINAVNNLIGQGVRWDMFVDDNLTF